MSSYQKLASIYDYLMRDIDYDSWFAHYMKLLSSITPCQRILEAGCGTGNFTFRLARHFDIHGVELSQQMLKRAKNKAKTFQTNHEITFECANICQISKQEKLFDAAVAAFDVMNCITEEGGLEQAFKAISQNLRAGGMLIFDVNTEAAFLQGLFDEDVVCLENGYSHVWRGYYELQTRTEKIEMKYYMNGDLLFIENQLQRAYTEEEIIAGLEKTGFTDIQFYNAWTMEAPQIDCDRWLVSGKWDGKN